MKRLSLALLALTVEWLSLRAQPVITTQPTNQVVWNGSSVLFSVGVSGTGPLKYQWQFNGTNLPNNIITTVAGDGFRSPYSGYYRGDGGAATNASLYFPSGLALDAAGNLYIADTSNQRIRKMDTNGIITTIAGTGTNDYAGDGGYATNASFNLTGSWSMNAVAGLCADKKGNLFIADFGNNRIRKIDTNGIITSVAGKGVDGYSGDGGPATSASLSMPTGMAFDNQGNLYIADMNNSRIRKVDTNGLITTFAGSGGELYLPHSVATDTNGNVFIADTYRVRVRKVDTNGVMSDVAGYGIINGFSGDGGPATNAQLTRPKGVALDPAQNLFVVDTLNQRVRMVDSNGVINTVVGNGAGSPNGAFGGDGGLATSGSLEEPVAVAFGPSGNMYIADSWNDRIRFVPFGGLPRLALSNVSLTNNGSYCVVVTDSSGSVTSSVVSLTVLVPATISAQPVSQYVAVGSNFTLSVGAFGSPQLSYQWFLNGVAVIDQTNSTFAAEGVSTNEAGNYTVIVTNLYGRATSSVASMVVGYVPHITSTPSNPLVLIGGNAWLNVGVAGTGPLTFQWQRDGTNLPKGIITTVAGKSGSGFSGDNGAATNAALNSPVGAGADAAGNLFIADSSNNRIRRVDADGVISTVAGNGNASYSGDGAAATNAALNNPAGVLVDAKGNLVIADTLNSRVRRVDDSGRIATLAGTNSAGSSGDGGAAVIAKLYRDSAMAADGAGNLYIADTYNSRIRKLDVNGIITTVAGNGTAGFSGDGGSAVSASVNFPFSVAVDGSGNLFIADTRNNRIRRVSRDGIISTVAGRGPSYPGSGLYSGDGGPATNAYLNTPRGVAVDPAGNLFIADAANNRVRAVDAKGVITTVAGKSATGFSGDGGAATNASLSVPEGIAFDSAGNLLIADTANARIRMVLLYGSYSNLSLLHLKPSDSGSYAVIVTNPFGSVTSGNYYLAVVGPPVLSASRGASGALKLAWSAQSNLTYQLQYTTNLAAPVWQNLGDPVTATNGLANAEDFPQTDTQRFYRASVSSHY
jgi:sugar lactone lactonase YvrE